MYVMNAALFVVEVLFSLTCAGSLEKLKHLTRDDRDHTTKLRSGNPSEIFSLDLVTSTWHGPMDVVVVVATSILQ